MKIFRKKYYKKNDYPGTLQSMIRTCFATLSGFEW